MNNGIASIGSRLQLFLDDQLLETTEGVRHCLHRPERREVVLAVDQPWEKLWQRDKSLDPTPIGYSSIMQDGDLFRLYYTWDLGGMRPALTGYAESRDGIHWTKPTLGLVDFEGSRDNNLVWAGARDFDFTPFRDANPAAAPDQQYKTLVGSEHVALGSADGLRWRQISSGAVITDGAFDSQNVAFWDACRDRYVAYYRDFVDIDGERIRAVKRATSPDFLNWGSGELLDYGDAPLEHFYTNGILPYFRAPDVYVGFPMRYIPGRKAVPEHPYDGVSDVVFMFSRDGVRWDRRFMDGFIRPGPERENWTERNFLNVWGIVPTGPAEMSLYWIEHFRHPTNRIRRGVLRTDGFVSLQAGYAGGAILTRPLVFAGGKLLLNFATSAAGSVKVEVLHPTSEAVAGFSGDSSPELYGDAIAGEYYWTSTRSVAELAGQPVRLRIHLKDSDLYSLQFR